MSKFITDRVTVDFAWLNKPDTKFGEDTANFNLSIEIDENTQEQLKSAVKKLGATKLNGVWEKDGKRMVKFKNRILVKNGATSFPCVDSQNKPTQMTASGGDVVRLLLSPKVISRDNSLSVYLEGVQIIEKNSDYGGGGAGFDAVDGAWTDDAPKAAPVSEPAPAAQPDVENEELDDDLPF